MPIQMPRRRHSTGLACLLLAMLAGPAGGQATPPAADTARTAADTATAAIRVEDIPASADATASRLRDLQDLIAADPAKSRTIQQVQSLADSVPDQIRVERAAATRTMARRGLLASGLEWERRSLNAQEYRKDLQGRITDLQAARDAFAAGIARWTLTIEAARRAAATPRVIGLAEATLRDLRQEDRRVKRLLDQLLSVEVRLSELQLQIRQQQQFLDEQAAQQRRALLTVDSPPLWRLDEALSLADLRDRFASLSTDHLKSLAEFAGMYAWRLVFHLLVTLLLIRLFRRGRARLARDPHDPLHAEGFARILQRPDAAALEVSALALLVLYPQAPIIAYDVAMILAVPPLMQLRQVLLPPGLRRVTLHLGILVVIHRLLSLLGPGTNLERINALGVAAAGAVLLWRWLGESDQAEPGEAAAWQRIARPMGKVLLAGFGVSLLANLVGNTSLAITTTSTILFLGLAVMVLVAGTMVLDVALFEVFRVGSRYSRFLAAFGDVIRRRLSWLMHAGAVLGWVWLALVGYYVVDDVTDMLKRWLAASWSIGELSISLGTALLFFLVLWAGVMLARLVSRLLELDVLGRLDLDRGVPVTMGSLVGYALVAIAFLTALAATGFHLGQLAIIGGALGVGIGFGLQNLVSNFVSGLILAFERPISPGDVVQVGERLGEVRSIGIRASILHTFDGAEVIVPNSLLISNEVINWTRSDRLRRIEVLVGVAYGTDPKRVLPLLLEAATGHPEVARTPEPDARFIRFGESSLDFSLRFWGDFLEGTRVQSDVSLRVHDALAAAGIGIPFPQRDLHLRSADREVVSRVGQASTGGGPA